MPFGQRIVKPSLWVEALLIVLALLGHDLLMASHAPEATAAQATDTRHQHGSTHAAIEITATRSHGDPGLPHPRFCGVSGTALLERVSPLGIPSFTASLPATAWDLSAPGHVKAFLWEEPRWPPGTRRALLQVYRI